MYLLCQVDIVKMGSLVAPELLMILRWLRSCDRSSALVFSTTLGPQSRFWGKNYLKSASAPSPKRDYSTERVRLTKSNTSMFGRRYLSLEYYLKVDTFRKHLTY